MDAMCSEGLHPMKGRNVSQAMECKACARTRDSERRAERAAELGKTVGNPCHKPRRYIYPDDYVPPPEPKAVPPHKRPTLARIHADPDVERYHMERAASAMRVRSRDNERVAEWGGHARGFPSFREFASAPSRDYEVIQPETA